MPPTGPSRRRLPFWVVAVAIAGAAACATAANAPDGTAAGPTSLDAIAVPTGVLATDAPGTTEVEDVVVEADDFTNLHDMAKVRNLYIDNVLGHLDEAVAAAESPTGGFYPVGTIIQLIPQEAMVKRAFGYNVAYGDWEFFELVVSPEGTTISKRGGREVVNRFGGVSCADCHVKAHPDFDFVCEKNRGCDPLPIPDSVFLALAESDPRPRRISD